MFGRLHPVPVNALLLLLVAAWLIAAYAPLFRLGFADMPRTRGVVIASCLIGAAVLCYFLIPAKQAEKLRGFASRVTFTADALIIKSVSPVGESVVTYRYDSLKKAAETRRYLFFFLSRAQAVIVDKATLSGSTAADLRRRVEPYLKKGAFLVCRY